MADGKREFNERAAVFHQERDDIARTHTAFSQKAGKLANALIKFCVRNALILEHDGKSCRVCMRPPRDARTQCNHDSSGRDTAQHERGIFKKTSDSDVAYDYVTMARMRSS